MLCGHLALGQPCYGTRQEERSLLQQMLCLHLLLLVMHLLALTPVLHAGPCILTGDGCFAADD